MKVVTPQRIEYHILATIIYFDIYDFPLTSFEIFQYLLINIPGLLPENKRIKNKDISLGEIEKIIKESDFLKKRIEFKNGFYFVRGREDIIQSRLKRYNLTFIKFKIIKRITKIFSLFPFIKLICFCNTLSYSNSKEKSDIDLFVVTTRNRIWISRLVCVLLLEIFRLRPKKEDTKNKICMSFWVTENHCNLKKICKDPYDIYLYYWLIALMPIYDQDNYFERLMNKNQWIRNYIPNFLEYRTSHNIRIKSKGIFVKKILEVLLYGVFGDFIERLAKKFQLWKMNDIIKIKSYENKNVIINDNMLKFHTIDRRENYREIFENRYEKNITKTDS